MNDMVRLNVLRDPLDARKITYVGYVDLMHPVDGLGLGSVDDPMHVVAQFRERGRDVTARESPDPG